jgi:hypothetical protein
VSRLGNRVGWRLSAVIQSTECLKSLSGKLTRVLHPIEGLVAGRDNAGVLRFSLLEKPEAGEALLVALCVDDLTASTGRCETDCVSRKGRETMDLCFDGDPRESEDLGGEMIGEV